MDNQRIFIFIGLILTGFLFYQEFESSKQVKLDKTNNPNQTIAQNLTNNSASLDIPSVVAQSPVSNLTNNADDLPSVDNQEVSDPVQNQDLVNVQTDLLTIKINKKGATISELWLNNYPVSLEQNADNVQLFDTKFGQKFVAQSGLISKANLPTHHSQYQVKQNNYTLEDAQQLSVPFYWQDNNGLSVVKTYHFNQGEYLIKVSYQLTNNSQNQIDYASYAQLLRDTLAEGSLVLPTYSGGAIYDSTTEVYEKVEFGDFKTQQPITTQGGWLAMVQHYFFAAWIPNQDQNQRYSAKELGDGANILSVVGAPAQLNPGQSIIINPVELYAGPKLQKKMASVQGLDKTVDYGVLYIIAKPLEVVLHWIYDFVASWGLSIILLTLLIKLIFYKLSETSYRSMAKMRKLGPKMQQLKELYGDDKQKISKKMMALYKEEKVNPAAGCLPIFVQIPVFISLYWVLLESVELRQVSFWWLSDLSSKDPYFILPVLMGISMYIQQQLNPTPPDPMQAKVMAALPFVFTIFFFWMPSGLVLYWVINNVLSIAQQWVINKRIVG